MADEYNETVEKVLLQLSHSFNFYYANMPNDTINILDISYIPTQPTYDNIEKPFYLKKIICVKIVKKKKKLWESGHFGVSKISVAIIDLESGDEDNDDQSPLAERPNELKLQIQHPFKNDLTAYQISTPMYEINDLSMMTMTV